jgi:hypothetical protein
MALSSASLAIPTVLLLATTALSIAGNAAKAFSFNASGYDATFHLWRANVCSAAGCFTISHSDLGAGSGSCDFRHQYRAAQAFGILACMVSGSLLLVCLANLASVCSPTVSASNLQLQTFGSFLLIGVEILAFITFVTIKNLDCWSSLNVSYEAAPFLFLGCIVLGLLYLAWSVFAQAPEEDEEPATPARAAADQQPPQSSDPSSAHRNQTATTAAAEPSSPLASAVAAAAAQPPPQYPSGDDVDAHPRRPVLAASSTEELAVPEGDDWLFDQSTGLSWSESMKLFFDAASAQFYDPGSELWYDPSVGRWHRLAE